MNANSTLHNETADERAATAVTGATIPPVPATLETAQSKLVYVTLRSGNGMTVDELAGALGMKKIALFDVLSTLDERDLVDCRNGEYVLTQAA